MTVRRRRQRATAGITRIAGPSPRRLKLLISGVITFAVMALVGAIAVVIGHGPEQSSRPGTVVAAPTPVSSSERGVTVRRYEYPTAGTADPRQDFGDLYLPGGRHDTDSVPLVVLVHGGGWTSRYSANYMAPMARSLAERGLAVYNVEYRRLGSGGGWPGTFTDVAATVDFVPTLAHLNPEIDTSDSVIVGHSAGAQLAVWVGTRGGLAAHALGPQPRWQPARIISLAGPLDMALAAQTGDTRVIRILGGTPAEVPDRYRTVDPIENIDPTVPITVVHGTADRVVSPSQSMAFVAAEQRAHGDARLVLLRGQSHSALVTPRSVAYPQVVDLIVDSVRRSP